jgi:hypothetical protein
MSDPFDGCSFQKNNHFSDALQILEAIELNNQGTILDESGHYLQAINVFKQAVALKKSIFGENSVHVCISLCGLTDAYLHNKDFSKAHNAARKMLKIALVIQSEEQLRVARELLEELGTHIGETKV